MDWVLRAALEAHAAKRLPIQVQFLGWRERSRCFHKGHCLGIFGKGGTPWVFISLDNLGGSAKPEVVEISSDVSPYGKAADPLWGGPTLLRGTWEVATCSRWKGGSTGSIQGKKNVTGNRSTWRLVITYGTFGDFCHPTVVYFRGLFGWLQGYRAFDHTDLICRLSMQDSHMSCDSFKILSHEDLHFYKFLSQKPNYLQKKPTNQKH